MKLLVILCIEEMQETIAHLLHDSGITSMGVAPFKGYRKTPQCSVLGWFGRGSACEQANSQLMFSFTSEDTAEKAITLINQYNTEHPSDFAPRAYVLPVSASSALSE